MLFATSAAPPSGFFTLTLPLASGHRQGNRIMPCHSRDFLSLQGDLTSLVLPIFCCIKFVTLIPYYFHLNNFIHHPIVYLGHSGNLAMQKIVELLIK